MSRKCSLWANKTVIYLLSCEMVIVKCFGARCERCCLHTNHRTPKHRSLPRTVMAYSKHLLCSRAFRRSMHINLRKIVLFTERLKSHWYRSSFSLAPLLSSSTRKCKWSESSTTNAKRTANTLNIKIFLKHRSTHILRVSKQQLFVAQTFREHP